MIGGFFGALVVVTHEYGWRRFFSRELFPRRSDVLRQFGHVVVSVRNRGGFLATWRLYRPTGR